MKTSKRMAIFAFNFLLVFGGGQPTVPAKDAPAAETAGAEQDRFKKARRAEEQSSGLFRAKEETPVTEEKAKHVSEIGPVARFRLKTIEVIGNERIQTQELKRLGEDLIGHEVSLDNLNEIASRMKNYYRTQGYLAAYVYIPPQDVTAGAVEFVVIEGRLGNVEIKGNHWYSARVIKRMLGLASGQVIFYRDLRRALTFLNRQEDLKTKAVLKPGAEPRTTDIEVGVKDRFPVHFSTDVNNQGTRNTGRARWGVSLSDNNLLGQMDQADGRFQLGKGMWAVGANYQVPLHASGTTASFSFGRSAINLGGEFKALNVKGDATSYGIELQQPFLHDPLEATADIGFDWEDVENRVLDRIAGKDRLRILNVGINFEQSDRWGRTYFPNSFHFGFDSFLGASEKVDPDATRPGTGGQFFIYRLSLLRYVRLPFDMTFAFRGSLQLTPDRLAPSEQLRLGGAFSVRGYPEGEYLADDGAHFSTELFIPTYFFPENWKLPFASTPLRKQIQGVGFFDFGAGQLRRPLSQGEESHRTLSGLGGGIRIHLKDRLYARFQWAGRTGEKSREGVNSAFYFGISMELF